MSFETETIAAIATPPGRGGVGILRISGHLSKAIAESITDKKKFPPRLVTYAHFYDETHELIDIGLVLYFPAPHSFTGEDVVELHGHGGAIVLDNLLQRVLQLGARPARPGEFSERAFLNDKIDLAQAEAIADLIDSTSKQAARCAVRSLQGDFSKKIHALVDKLIHLRMYIEAAIDFPEEEIDFLSDAHITNANEEIINQLETILKQAQQGVLLREGRQVVIAGHPNAGKSTLLNQLSGRESAIVTDIPGTTRDVMREYILLEGIPLHIIDTAGLRDSDDVVEQEGIRRAWQAIKQADHVLLLLDCSQQKKNEINNLHAQLLSQIPEELPVTVIVNKIDLTQQAAKIDAADHFPTVFLSAKTGDGIDLLRKHLKQSMNLTLNNEGGFIARRRHLDALHKALIAVKRGYQQLIDSRAGELFADDLLCAQQSLNTITGEFSADDLLGKIFSSFCIGK